MPDTIGEASRSLPGAPERKQEQDDGDNHCSVTLSRPHPWADG